jgi:microcystin degradation protein MlrC
MADTGARAFDLLESLIAGKKLHKVLRKIPFLIPLTSQCTDFEPCRSIYSLAAELSRADAVANVEFGAGFPPSDITECGPGIVAYGENREAAEAAAGAIYRRIVDAEADFEFELLDADSAVARAMTNTADRPVVIADAQDNPGAGATSDTTGLLDALLRRGAQRAVLAMLYDPPAARKAHELGVGAEFDAELGAKSGFAGVEALPCRLRVEALGDGDFIFTGEMQLNSHAQLGPMALLRVIDENADLRVIVGVSRFQCLDQAILRHVGVEPAEEGIVAVKSTVHFRADFDPIAAETLVAISPGANYCRMRELKFENLRSGVRLGPLGPEHQG